MMLSSVDLPPPDGPVMTTNERGSTSKAMFLQNEVAPARSPTARKHLAARCVTARRARFTGAICWPSRSSGCRIAELDDLHDDDEGQRIGQDHRHVEQLEGDVELMADAVGAPEGFDHEHDLPDERQPRARRGGEERRQLRQRHVAQRLPPAEAVDVRHLVEIARQAARALAHGHGDVRDLVDGDRGDRRDLRQPEPDVAKDDDDERRQIEEEDQPGVEEAVGRRIAARARRRWPSR